jgi:hypothetical protein
MPLVETTALSSLAGEIGGYGPVRLWGSVGFVASVLGVSALLDVYDRAPVDDFPLGANIPPHHWPAPTLRHGAAEVSMPSIGVGSETMCIKLRPGP